MDILNVALGSKWGQPKKIDLRNYVNTEGVSLNDLLVMSILGGGGKTEFDFTAFLEDCNTEGTLRLMVSMGDSAFYVDTAMRVHYQPGDRIVQLTCQFCACMSSTKYFVSVFILDDQMDVECTVVSADEG